jgi:hypothetical protein
VVDVVAKYKFVDGQGRERLVDFSVKPGTTVYEDIYGNVIRDDDGNAIIGPERDGLSKEQHEAIANEIRMGGERASRLETLRCKTKSINDCVLDALWVAANG